MGQTPRDTAGEMVRVATAPLVVSTVETLSGVVEEAGHRGGAAWAALRSERGDLALVRRWPWALSAAVAGAAAGVAAAYVVGRLRTHDVPGAVEAEQIVAVVDRPSA